MTASTILTAGSTINLARNVNVPNRFVEIGCDLADSMYLDFHSKDSTLPDYSTRIISQGGATTGTGNLNMYASTIGMMCSAGVGIGTTAPTAALQIKSATTAMRISGNLTNASTRPVVSTTPGAFEIRGSSATGDTYDDGFLRLSAGGGTNTNQQSYIDLSASSTVGDMDKNIVFGTQGTERMRIIGNGNVGIGTTSPANLLTVAQLGSNYSSPVLILDAGIVGNTTAGAPRGIGRPLLGIGNSSFTGGGVAGDYYGIGFGYGGGGSSSYYPAEIGLYVQSTSGAEYGDIVFSTRSTTANVVATERMRITNTGFVGIGITNPSCPLYVNTSFNINIGGGNWTASNYNVALAGPFSSAQDISAYFSRYASSGLGFLTYSDKRIKKDIEPATNCLDIVTKLKPVTYRKKNVIEDGNNLHTGFIAQDVEEIYPSAITKRTDTIPSIYEIRHAVLIENGIQIMESIDVPLDAKVMVIDFNNKKITMIHHPNNILLFENEKDTIELDGDKVFIFGHEVSDKLMLNHDTIFAVGMGAIKELSEKATLQASLVQELATQTAQLSTENTRLKSQLTTLEARLAAAGF